MQRATTEHVFTEEKITKTKTKQNHTDNKQRKKRKMGELLITFLLRCTFSQDKLVAISTAAKSG